MADEERDLNWLRRQFVIALAADDELFELLVLKGGNALALAHGIGMRASLDLDYSLAKEAESDDELGRALKQALDDHLGRLGLTVFDWKFGPRPTAPKDKQSLIWGDTLASSRSSKRSVGPKSDITSRKLGRRRGASPLVAERHASSGWS